MSLLVHAVLLHVEPKKKCRRRQISINWFKIKISNTSLQGKERYLFDSCFNKKKTTKDCYSSKKKAVKNNELFQKLTGNQKQSINL